MNCTPDARIRSATTDVSRHGLVDIVVGRLGIFFEQDGCAHDLSGLAVAALWDVNFDPCALHGMRVVRGKPFDGGNVLAFDTGERRDTRAYRATVEMDRTRAAESHSSAKLGSSQIHFVADGPEQRHFGTDIQLIGLVIDVQSDHRELSCRLPD